MNGAKPLRRPYRMFGQQRHQHIHVVTVTCASGVINAQAIDGLDVLQPLADALQHTFYSFRITHLVLSIGYKKTTVLAAGAVNSYSATKRPPSAACHRHR